MPLSSLAPLLGLAEAIPEAQSLAQRAQQTRIQQQLAEIALSNQRQQQQQYQQQQDILAAAGQGLLSGAGQTPQMPPPQLPQVPNLTGAMNAPGGGLGAGTMGYPPGSIAGANVANFNYGNIKAPGGGYASYSSPQQGVEAISQLVGNYQNKYGLNTEADIINRYAPQSDPGNRGKPLVQEAARVSGLDPNAPQNFAPGTPANQAMTKAILTQEQGSARADQILRQVIAPPAIQLVQSGTPPPAVKPLVDAAKAAGAETDPQTWGRNSAIQIMQAVDKANPDASPQVKMGATLLLQKLMLPEDQIWYRAQMQQSGLLTQLLKTQMITDRSQQTSQATTERVLSLEQMRERYKSQNPQTNAYLQFLEENPNATAQERQQFLQSLRAAPRSLQALAAQSFARDNPGAGPEAIESFAAGFASRVSTERAFGPGKQGDTIRNLNVAMLHQDTLIKLFDALQNNDTPLFNSIKNALQTQFGYAGPMEFNAAKGIVAREVAKATAGGLLTGEERKDLDAKIAASSSPEQLHGMINETFRPLLAGQLAGLKQQYTSIPGTTEEGFERKLMPETKQILEGQKSEPQKPAAQAPSPEAVVPPVGFTKMYNGQIYSFKGGDQYDKNNWEVVPSAPQQ